MKFTLRQLEYFIAAAESGSVAGAAQRASISSPSVSTAIAHLEREFVVQLFVRHHAQGLSLTPAIVREIAPDRAGRETILYLMTLAISAIVFGVVYLLLRSRHGLALTAIRDSEPASAPRCRPKFVSAST